MCITEFFREAEAVYQDGERNAILALGENLVPRKPLPIWPATISDVGGSVLISPPLKPGLVAHRVPRESVISRDI